MKKSILFLASILFTVFTYGQEYEVHGVIKDESGLTLPGVSIYVKETNQGTTTDFDGKYKIKVEGKVNILFSFMGMQNERYAVSKETTLNLVMRESANVLDEITIVGYGSQKKSDKTGSVSSIKETENMKKQYNTVDGLLQGRISGIQVSSMGGQPGGGISVKIRGINSLRGNNEPLYVIDGVVISSAGEDTGSAFSDGNEASTPSNGLAGINPRDIESMEVLKDASATALYGSRGANGVILITTKQGKKGKAKFNAYTNVEISNVSRTLDVLSPAGYAQFQNAQKIEAGNAPPYNIKGDKVYKTVNGVDIEIPQIDWQSETFETGLSVMTGVSVSGGGEKSKYYLSGGFNNLNGIVPTSNIQSADFRMNLQNKVTKKLKIDTRIALYYSRGSFAQGGNRAGGNSSFINNVVTYQPLIESSDGYDDENLSSPYAWIKDYDDVFNEYKMNASVNLSYSINKHLKYQLRLGTNVWKKDRRVWYGTLTYQGAGVNGRLGIVNMARNSYVMDNLLMFNKRIGKGRFDGVFGIVVDGVSKSEDKYETADFNVKDHTYEAPQFGQIVVKPYTTRHAEEHLFSVLARGTYTYKDKYIFTGTIRADGSSKFQDENQFGYFPSLSAAWRMSQEDFLSDSDLISSLKLRASWGITGNQAIKPYQTYGSYLSSYYVDYKDNSIIGAIPENISNETLKWESTSQYNLGVDFGLWGGKLSGSIDAYYKETSDLLQQMRVPNSIGYKFYLTNRGDISNQGIDISLDGVIVDTEDWYLTLGGNISFNRNKVLDLGIPPSIIYVDGKAVEANYYLGNTISTGKDFKMPANIFMEGQKVGLFWGYKTDGIVKDDADAANSPSFFGIAAQPGDIKYVDVSGDGNINSDDLSLIGDPNPDFTFGINSSLSYKKITFSMLWTGSYGNEIAQGSRLSRESVTRMSNILEYAYYDAWTPNHTDAAMPRLNYEQNGIFSDRIVEDGSYLRLSKITLGYDMEFEGAITDFNVFITATNLFTFTNYSGFDPEVSSFMFDGTIIGVDWNGFPNSTSLLLGLSINF
jgi:TonB-linked SusC/RagA family outer membrane protein